MFKANVDGVEIHYQRLGKGEPVVFLHGLGEIKEGWAFQHELADEYDLIIPDLRGHGESTTTDGITLENFAIDVLNLLDYLGIETAHICGLSMGGVVAQEIYRLAPERCRSLMLVSTFYYFPRTFGTYYYYLRKHRALNLTSDQQRELSARTCLYSWNEELKDTFLKSYKPNKEAYLKSMEACLHVNNISLVQKIAVPTLVIGGQYDAVTPIWIQIAMHKRIPNSKLVIFKDAGHITKLEVADQFNQTVRKFLASQQEQAVS